MRHKDEIMDEVFDFMQAQVERCLASESVEAELEGLLRAMCMALASWAVTQPNGKQAVGDVIALIEEIAASIGQDVFGYDLTGAH